MSRRPRALVLAFHFPPGRGSGVHRNRAWATRLAHAGWDVTVLTVRREWFETVTGGVDDALAATVPPEVRIVRTRYDQHSYAPDVAAMPRLQANFPTLYISAMVEWPGKVFPERHALWYPVAVAAALRACARKRPDLIIGTANPYSTYAAARALSRIFRVPYVLDIRDSWTLDQFAEQDAYPPGHLAWTCERRAFADAALVVTVNEPLRGWFADRYPDLRDKFRVVENGWSPEILGEVPAPAPEPDRPRRFGYVGTLRPDLPYEEFFEGWDLARSHPAMAGATFDAYGYLGYFATSANRIRERLPQNHPDIRYHGPVSQTELAKTYSGLDVLVSLLPTSRYVTSAKVYDYLASARPIVAVHDPRTAATAAAAEYPLWFGVRAVTPEAVRDSLIEAAIASRAEPAQTIAACRAVAARHTREAHMTPIVREFEALAGVHA